MTKDEFRQFVVETLEAVIQLAEKHTGGKTLSRKIAFKWFHQEGEPLRENIVEQLVDKVFVDENHIYPCVDIGVFDVLADGATLIKANIAGYEPKPFSKNWHGIDGPFVHIVGQSIIDKSLIN